MLISSVHRLPQGFHDDVDDAEWHGRLYSTVEQPVQHATAIPSRKYPLDVPHLSVTFCSLAIPYDVTCVTRDIVQKFPRNLNQFPVQTSHMPALRAGHIFISSALQTMLDVN